MPNYRRAFVPGGCWFFTVNLLERRNTLLVDRIDALRDAMERTRGRHAFGIDPLSCCRIISMRYERYRRETPIFPCGGG
jgi:REP element-mobilizing transposase RayT